MLNIESHEKSRLDFIMVERRTNGAFYKFKGPNHFERLEYEKFKHSKQLKDHLS